MVVENILLLANIGFWFDMCKDNIPDAKFLPQSEADVLSEFIGATNFSVFQLRQNEESRLCAPDRIMVHITNDDAQATYYIAYLEGKKRKYVAFLTV